MLPCKQPTQFFCFPEHLENQPTHQYAMQFMQHYAVGMLCTASMSTATTSVKLPKILAVLF